MSKRQVDLLLPPFLSAVLPCASSLACPAHRSYRALWASRFSRHTNQGSELHDGLVELPGAFSVAGHQSAGEIPDATWRDGALPDGALPGEALPVVSEEDSQEYASHVCVHSGQRLLVRERRYRASSIRPDPRELDELFWIIGQRGNAVSGNAPSGNASPGNALCQRMEIPRARIVSQPIPSLTHRARPRPRQTREIRKPLEKSRIVLRHAAHLCLLQHELGHEHAVRIARLAPWQVARGAGPPGEELARKYLCARGLAHAGGRRTGHGYPRYSP